MNEPASMPSLVTTLNYIIRINHVHKTESRFEGCRDVTKWFISGIIGSLQESR